MSDDYTPTTNEVAHAYQRAAAGMDQDGRRHEFDRWLAEHDSEVARQVVAEIARRIEPFSGIGLANGASRAEIAEWVRTDFLEPLSADAGKETDDAL